MGSIKKMWNYLFRKEVYEVVFGTIMMTLITGGLFHVWFEMPSGGSINDFIHYLQQMPKRNDAMISALIFSLFAEGLYLYIKKKEKTAT